MNRKGHSQLLWLVAALAMLSLRALTPEGYMPGSRGSGLLFELCPSGMPVEIMRALGRGHHHHHGDPGSGSGTEQCPIGHMLGAAVATDSGLVAAAHVPAPAWLEPASSAVPVSIRPPLYRSRAPPA